MLIKLKNISKKVMQNGAPLTILEKINLEISAGNIHLLVGDSGSGKTTILNIIATIDQAYTGEFLYAGKPISQFKDKDLSRFRNQNIGVVFQENNLISEFSTLQNIALPLLFSGEKLSVAREKALEILTIFHMESLADKDINLLSGGEKKRIALLRAVINKPALLLCDEPTVNLDKVNAKKLSSFIASLNRKYQTTILIATHNEATFKNISNKIYLRKGKVTRNIRV